MKYQEKIALATKLIDKKEFFLSRINFNKIYPFTTENIASYIDYFDLKDKSLLTVGSSSDQVFNAVMKGCKDITVLDKSPFTKEYFYLKKAAIMSLEPEDFIEMFSLRNCPNEGDINNKAFNYDSVEEVLSNLIYEDLDSYYFWNGLFNKREVKEVRDKLFIHDESNTNTLLRSNNYLSSKEDYYKLQNLIEDIRPNFLIQDIRNPELDKGYDNIFLSNIFDFIKKRDAFFILDRVLPYLNEDGKILIYYLYSITLNDDIPTIEELYDPNYVIRYVPYNSVLIPLPSIEEKNIKQKDGIIVYKKEKRNDQYF